MIAQYNFGNVSWYQTCTNSSFKLQSILVENAKHTDINFKSLESCLSLGEVKPSIHNSFNLN